MMSIAVKWRSANRSIGISRSATREQAGCGFVENPGDLSVMWLDNLRWNLVGIARPFEDIFHHCRLALPRHQEHHALSVIDHRRRDGQAIARFGVDLDRDHHALRFMQCGIAGEKRRGMAILAEPEQYQV